MRKSYNYEIILCCLQLVLGNRLDPDSVGFWIRFEIVAPDPGAMHTDPKYWFPITLPISLKKHYTYCTQVYIDYCTVFNGKKAEF